MPKRLIQKIKNICNLLFSSTEKRTFLHNFFAFFICSFIAASAIFYVISYITEGGYPVLGFIPFTRGGHYQYEYPSQYIALVCFFYSIFSAKLAPCITRKGIFMGVTVSLIIVVAAPAAASPFGGMLIHLHDMLAGFFPDTQGVITKLLTGIRQGVGGLLILIITGHVYALICTIAGTTGTIWLSKKLYPPAKKDRSDYSLSS